MSVLSDREADARSRIRSRQPEEIFAQLKWLRDGFGYKPGWVAFKFKQIFNQWPNRMDHIAPELPSVELQEWVYREKELRLREWKKANPRPKRPAAPVTSDARYGAD